MKSVSAPGTPSPMASPAKRRKSELKKPKRPDSDSDEPSRPEPAYLTGASPSARALINGETKATGPNAAILEAFLEYVALLEEAFARGWYRGTPMRFKKSSLLKAVVSIEALDRAIVTKGDALAVRGVGDKLAGYCVEVLDTDTIRDMDDLRAALGGGDAEGDSE